MEIGATKAVQDRLKTTKIEESKGASLVFCWDTHLTKIKGRNVLSLDVVCHFPLNMLIKNPQLLNDRECQYAMNPATHLDFLIYNRISKKPVLAIEVDGYEFHKWDLSQPLNELKRMDFQKCIVKFQKKILQIILKGPV